LTAADQHEKVSFMAPVTVEEPDVSGLVTENDRPVGNILSEKQQRLLTEPLYSSWSGPPPDEVQSPRPFAALANVGLFVSPHETPVVPDVMLSVDVTLPKALEEKNNRSYFIWRFGKSPEVVIEIVSNRKGGELSDKFKRYRRIHIPYYVVYDPLRMLGQPTLRTFEMRGELYVAVERPWFEGLGLGLIEWKGSFEGASGLWLRWCTRDGCVVPTGAERAETAEARAETAEARAETAEARAERLAARLRAMGIDPESA
jgi:hypothetical protein